MSTSVKVVHRIQRMKRGIPFSIKRFYELGSHAAVQKALSRLNKEGVIERVDRGIYVRPKPLESIPSIKVTASADQVARVWAREHNYKLVTQGLEAAYRLGLQTQAPVKTIYWSNGPNKTFSVGNDVVEVRHTSERRLCWITSPEGELLRGLIVTPASSVEQRSLKTAFKRLGLSKEQIQVTVSKLKSSTLPNAWQRKLEEFEVGY